MEGEPLGRRELDTTTVGVSVPVTATVRVEVGDTEGEPEMREVGVVEGEMPGVPLSLGLLLTVALGAGVRVVAGDCVTVRGAEGVLEEVVEAVLVFVVDMDPVPESVGGRRVGEMAGEGVEEREAEEVFVGAGERDSVEVEDTVKVTEGHWLGVREGSRERVFPPPLPREGEVATVREKVRVGEEDTLGQALWEGVLDTVLEGLTEAVEEGVLVWVCEAVPVTEVVEVFEEVPLEVSDWVGRDEALAQGEALGDLEAVEVFVLVRLVDTDPVSLPTMALPPRATPGLGDTE